MFPKPTIISCLKCGGFMYENTGGFVCGSCGMTKPPEFIKATDNTVKEGI